MYRKCHDISPISIVSYRVASFDIVFQYINIVAVTSEMLVISGYLSYFFGLFNINFNTTNYMTKTEYLIGKWYLKYIN